MDAINFIEPDRLRFSSFRYFQLCIQINNNLQIIFPFVHRFQISAGEILKFRWFIKRRRTVTYASSITSVTNTRELTRSES